MRLTSRWRKLVPLCMGLLVSNELVFLVLVSSDVSEIVDVDPIAYPNAGADKLSLSNRLCTRSEMHRGEWVAKRYERLPYLPKQIERKQCYTEIVTPWDTYEWQPSAECEFTEWSADLFCRLAQNKTIAIMGDSMSMEHFSALVHMMGITEFDEESTFASGGPQEFTYPMCNGDVRLFFRRSNMLDEVDKVLDATRPDVFILNRGSWYVYDQEFMGGIQALISVLQRWQQIHDFHFIWRTTVPGHPDCERFTRPATNVTEMENHVANRTLYRNWMRYHHWWDFRKQNEMVLEALNSSGLEYDIMDAYHVNILRPDDHLGARHDASRHDCLHNCQPGSKTLVYNQLLLHLMRQRIAESMSKIVQ